LIDIAVPRDVEDTVGDLPDVFLYNVDDLRQLVEEDMAQRRRKASHAEAIIGQEARLWVQKQRASLTAAPLITGLRSKHQALVDAEITRLRQRLPHLAPSDLQVIEAAFTAVGNKMLHDPTVKVREYAQSEAEDSMAKMETVREIFGLTEMVSSRTEERQ
jgi:glutamyl-tRNA reductase